jgi:hypothetical protein
MKRIIWSMVCVSLVLSLLLSACYPSPVTVTLSPTTLPVETSPQVTTTSTPEPESTTTQPEVIYKLSTSVNLQGGGYLSVSGGPYIRGSWVYITAVPYSGYAFDRWSGSASGTNATIALFMDSDKVLVANFIDIAPTVISNITLDITDVNTTVKWDTNEPATSQIEYGATTGYGLLSSVDSQYTDNHSITISGLQPDTVYHFRIKSIDKSGNQALSDDNIFNTKTLGQVVSAVISRSASGITYSLLNKSSQTIRVLKADLVDKDGIIRYTLDSSEVGIPYMTYLRSGEILTKSYSVVGQTYTNWRVIWSCKDVNLVPFTVISDPIFP